MSQAEQKVVQYLNEAHASEIALVSVLESQIAMAPRGSYRDGLEKHLSETRTHARRVRTRLAELGDGRNPFQVLVGLTETLVGQMLALSKAPLDMLRGSGGEEKMLKNAKDACATEALEIATYAAIERLASKVGDEPTAKLAASIRADEERMLARIMRELPKLTDAVVGAEVEGDPSYEITKTGAADATREVAHQARKTARKAQTRAARTARSARKADGAPRQRSSARARGAASTRISSVQAQEPWSGYDELTVAEIEGALNEGDDQRAQAVLAYERAHQNRPEVLRSALTPARFLLPANS
jgi:ferritin-like metal-binding protein YciE